MEQREQSQIYYHRGDTIARIAIFKTGNAIAHCVSSNMKVGEALVGILPLISPKCCTVKIFCILIPRLSPTLITKRPSEKIPNDSYKHQKG